MSLLFFIEKKKNDSLQGQEDTVIQENIFV